MGAVRRYPRSIGVKLTFGVPVNSRTRTDHMATKKIKYAIHVREDGAVDWVGEIVERSPEFISCEVIDAISALSGLWCLSGEVQTEPAREWRLFTDRDAALRACHLANEKVSERAGHDPRTPRIADLD